MFAGFALIEPAIPGFDPTGVVERTRRQRRNIAGKGLTGKGGHQIETGDRSSSPGIHDDDQPSDSAEAIWLRQACDLGIDGVGNLLGDQTAWIERQKAAR